MSRFHKLNFTHGLVRRRYLFNLIKRTAIIIILFGLILVCQYFYLTPEERDCVLYNRFGKLYPNMYIKNEVLKAVSPVIVDSQEMFGGKVTPSVVLDLFSGVYGFVSAMNGKESAGFSSIGVESTDGDGWCVSLSQSGKDSADDLLLALSSLTNNLASNNVAVAKVFIDDGKIDVSGQFSKCKFSDLDTKIDEKTTFFDLYSGKIRGKTTVKVKNRQKKSETDKSYDKWIMETKEYEVNPEVGMIYEELKELINGVRIEYDNSEKSLLDALKLIAVDLKHAARTTNATNLEYEAGFIVNPSDYMVRLKLCSQKAGRDDLTKELKRIDRKWNSYADSFLNLHPASHDKLEQLNDHIVQISLPSNETFIQLYVSTFNLLESYTNVFSSIDIDRGYKNVFLGVSDCMEFSSGKAKKLNDLFSTISWEISMAGKSSLNGRLDNYKFLESVVALCRDERERYQIATFSMNYECSGKEIKIKNLKLGGYVPVLNRKNLSERLEQLENIRCAREILGN